MSKIKTYGLKGEASGEKEIADGALELKRGSQAVADVVTAYRAGLRAGTASTKTRADVSGGGAKPFKQKGTGRARRGSSRSPVLRGGGVVFGPHPRSYAKKVNKKTVALAFRRALSDKIAEGALSVVEGLADVEPKTRAVAAMLKKVAPGKAVLLVTAESSKNLNLAARNIPGVEVTTAAQANTYQVTRYPVILADAAGLDALQKRISGED